MLIRNTATLRHCGFVLFLFIAGWNVAAFAADNEIVVVGTTPAGGLGQAVNKIPYAVQTASAADLEKSMSLDLSDFLNSSLASVSLNAAQNNPLQPDFNFRGFTASPLLGLPQGIAVYQNGVRINEPLGDAVNWDLLPESAIASISLFSGANPLFGLNSLGGALSVRMKNGFNFTDNQAEWTTGSWRRNRASVESGGNDGSWGYYLNASVFDEHGWRDLSESDAQNLYASLSWRGDEGASVDLNLQQGRSDLTGNGAAPVGLLALDRQEIFTAPDITENELDMASLNGSYYLNDLLQFSGTAFHRSNHTDSFNGDVSEYSLAELEAMRDELTGTGILSDEGINNISQRRQTSEGIDGQLLMLGEVFGRSNRLITGYSFLQGRSRFDAVAELSEMNPETRSTQGLGTGTFISEAATSIATEADTWSIYFSNTLDLSDRIALTLAGRYNNVDVQLRDRSDEHPELNGDHSFSRFNPSLGLTFALNDSSTAYLSYNEANRVPTPIELSCNEEIFVLAQEIAEATGDDPDDVEFECRLPNAFLADPPLKDVVTRNLEAGLRGNWQGLVYQLGLFHAVNRDDIIFQTTGRATGLFANVDRTRRMGLEATLAGTSGALDWFGAYSLVQASFEDHFLVRSPNHELADAGGNIAVSPGDRIPGIPRHQLKLGMDYSLGERLSLGMDGFYNSSQVMRGDESNQLGRVDGFAVLNLRASYQLNELFNVFLHISNLLDADYESFGLLGEEPDELLENLADERPYYLGPGAPRGVWIGARLQF